MARHLTMAELEAGLDEVRRSPEDDGVLELIVCRPRNGERAALEAGHLDAAQGLEGDNWSERGSRSTADGTANPETQLTITNSRATALVAQARERWQLAGDQLYIDMDLSVANVPPGTRLAVGEAIVEITAVPHTGCKKYVERFGEDALRFVNSPVGKDLCLRGINAKIVKSGAIRVGDVARKV